MFNGNVRRIATVLTASDRASGDLRSAEQAGDDAAESMDQAESSVATLSKTFTVLAGATVAAGSALAMLTRQHGRTEQTFARLQEVAGATDQEMQKMRDTAMTLGKELPIAMSDAANAMEQLSFAGFSAEEAMSAATGVAHLATASTMNMSQSARTASSALRMFGIEAENTHQVTATMAAVFSNSATNIQELSNAIEYVGATARSAGISLQEVSAAVGVLADRGIRASRAGTALNTTLQRIVSGSGQAQSALDRLNLSIEDLTNSAGEIESLGSVLSTIAGRMEGLESEAERLQVATELAGQRGARALLPLIENTEALNEKLGDVFRSEIQASIGELARLSQDQLSNVEDALEMDIDRENFTPQQLVRGLEQLQESGVGVDEMATKLQASLGISGQAAQSLARDVHDSSVSAEQLAESIGGATTASEIAAAQMDTTAGMVQFLRSSFSAMTFTIFTGAAPAIEWFNEKLATGINVLNENEAAMKAVGGTLAVLTGALALLTGVVGAAWVQASLGPAVMGALSGSFLTAALGASTLTGALSALLAPLAAIAAPALAIVAAVGLLIGAFMGLKKAIDANFLGVGDDVAVLMERLQALFGFLAPIAQELGGILVELGRILLMVAAAPLVAQVLAIIKGLRLLSDVVVWTVDAITGLINGTKSLEEVLGSAADGIVSFFAGIGSTIANALGSIDWGALALGIVQGLARGLGMAIGLWIKGWQLYLGFLVDFWTAVPGILVDVVTAIPGLLADAVVAGVGLWIKGWQMYIDFLIGFWTSVPGVLADVGRNIISGLMRGLEQAAPNVAKSIRKVVDVIASFLPWSNAQRGPLSSIMSVGGNIVSAIASGLRNGTNVVANAAGAVAGAIKGTFDDLASGAKKRGEALVSTVAEGAKSAGGKVKGAVEGAAEKASSVLPFSDAEEGPFSNLTERGRALVNTVAKGVEGEQSTLQSTLAAVAKGTPFGAAAEGVVGAIGSTSGAAQGGSAGGTGAGPVEIVLEQTVNFEGGAPDREELRRMVQEATRNGGRDALAELELLLKQVLSEGSPQ